MKRLFLASAILVSVSGSAIGATLAEGLQLRDHHGQVHLVPDLAKGNFTVVAFLGVECPLAKQYAVRLSELSKEYAAKGVNFIGVDANVQDSLAEMGAFVKSHGLTFPLVKDADGKLADTLSAKRTPEVVVLDNKGEVRYQGRIDDQFGFGLTAGYAKPTVSRRDLALALDQLLAGSPVEVATTKAEGCLIGRTPTTKTSSTVTYSNQIARIIQKRCLECHREGEAAPFPMANYSEVVGWAPMMREVVDLGRMPPWFADPKHGRFSNDPRLTDDEKAELAQWIDGGCPEGDPKDLPEPRAFVKGWSIGEPDAVFTMGEEPFVVPAEGVVDYKYYTVDTNFTEDKWIQASEALPGNREIVHHIIVFAAAGGER